MKEIELYVNKFADNAQSKTLWMILLGVLLVFFGVGAIVYMGITKLIVMYIFGSFMLAIGFFQLFTSLTIFRSFSKFIWIISSFLYMIVGCLITLQPLITTISLTNFIAFAFLGMGIFKIFAGLLLAPFNGWQWSLFSGVISILTAILLLEAVSEFTWVIGIFVGLDMVFQGSIFLVAGFTIQRIKRSI